MEHLFALDNNSISRRQFQVEKKHLSKQQTTIRHHFFINCVVDNWKSFPYDVVNATCINSFKNNLDKCWKNRMV